MAPPAASPGVDGGSPSRSPPAGVAEVSSPSSLPTASTGYASGEDSESSVAQPDNALSPVLGAAPRPAADTPEAASSAGSGNFQPQGSVSGSGAPDDGGCSAADAPRPPSLRREVDLRLEAERLCNQASHERNTALENLRRTRLDHADAARQLVVTNIALEQSAQAAAALEQRCRRLDKSLADTHKVIRQDREKFKAGISSYAAQLRQLREYLEQSDRQSSASGGASSASASAMPAAFATFLEEVGALQLAISPPPAASGSSGRSGPTPLASSGSLGGAAATSWSSTSLTVDSDTSDDSGPVIPSSLHKGKGKGPAKSSANLRSAPPPPKKKQRLGRPSVDLTARKAAKQATSAAVSSSGPSQSVPSSLPAASAPTSSAPIAGIAVSADSDVLSLASIPSGSDPPFSPIPRTPASPASSTASTASLPSTPVVSRGITPGTEASVPVEIDDDGGSGADGAASEASVAPGGVFASPAVSQPRRDGRPTRAASTTAGLRSMAAAENEVAPDALVLGLATPSHTPTATQASVASSASVLEPAESAAVVTAASARRRAANTHTGSVPPPRVVATPTPRQASTSSAVSGTGVTEAPRLGQPSVGACIHGSGGSRGLVRDIERIPQPIASDRFTECSVAGIQAFADWEDPTHPWQRLRARLPESPCTFGADDFMPDKRISIRASGLAIVVKLWRRFTGRAVGRTEHSDLGFALWERAHWISVAAVEQWLQQLSDRIGSDMPEYLEMEAAWRAYNKARNLRADRLRLQIPKRFWVWCTPDANGNKCPPEILLEPSMLYLGPRRSRCSHCGEPRVRPSHVTAPWVQEFSDAQAQAAADAPAPADSPSDASSAKASIPAADQADVRAELGANAPAQAGLDVLADLASTAEI
ncbi:unnamed protein product [Phytophthora fragariaefolia]|uniref:Unnamed protein product n=1 Tax=Phytophthora fragariaefolia TaxID=1490495 RepID=A0A9W6X454_9STRA|nr:unnamed protein product [Phytophthora fragariaefolia]